MGTRVWQRRLLTGLRWFVAVEFLTFPWLKFSPVGLLGYPAYPDKFVDWGYPAYFSHVVGVIELLAGLMLILPRRYFLGAVTLAGVMVGATVTHIIDEDRWAEGLSAPIHLVMAVIIALAWWPADWREPLGLRSRAGRSAASPPRQRSDVPPQPYSGVST